MSEFSQWNLREQKALYYEIAAGILPQWGLSVESIAWLSYSTNAVFLVHSGDGEFVLRLNLSERVEETNLRSELEWLCAIRQNTNLLAPLPVSLSVDGVERMYAMSSHELLPSPRIVYGTLFERIAGEEKSATDLCTNDVYQIGCYLGRLHRDAQFYPPAGFDRPRLDSEGLFGADSPYRSANERHVLESAQREIFSAVAQQVRDVMTRLDSDADSFGLIHADLLAKNILFHGSTIAALDFEFCGWGYFLYDLAPLLWQLKGERAAEYAQLEDALWAGYTSVRTASSAQRKSLEAFIAARQLASCRWLLQNLHHPKVRETAPALLGERTAELEGFLTSGILWRKSSTL